MHLEIPPGTPPQLRLRLLRLTDAPPEKVGELLTLALEHILRFFTGLTLQSLENEGTCVPADMRAMRAKTGTVQGCEGVFRSGVNSLSTRVRSWRSEQLLELFFGGIERPEDRALSRWLKLGGKPHPAPLLSQRPDGEEHLESWRGLLADWLRDATPIFSEEVWTLDRELATLMPAANEKPPRRRRPVKVPADPLAASLEELDACVEFWADLVLHPPLPLDDDALMDLLKHFLLAVETRARGHLGRNQFALAERDFGRLSGFAQGARGRHPLAPILACGTAGRGRARSCQGEFEQAERDLEIALRIHRELLQREPSPEGAAGLAWTLLYRALNRRCLGKPEEALKDLEVASQFAELAPEATVLQEALQQERAQPDKARLGEQIKRLKASSELPDKLELVCCLVERSYRIDPQLKDSRSTSDRKAALTQLNKLRRAHPELSLRDFRERPCRWGRSQHDLVVLESDLRFLRFTHEVFLNDPDLVPSLRDALELTEGMLEQDFHPERFVLELFETFGALAEVACDPTWQVEHWLRLRALFEQRGEKELAVRCMVLEGVARRDTPEALVRLLDQLGEVLARTPVMNGLEPLGGSFRLLRALQGRHPELRGSLRDMANRWRALPMVIPARAGADRPLLAALADKEFVS